MGSAFDRALRGSFVAFSGFVQLTCFQDFLDRPPAGSICKEHMFYVDATNEFISETSCHLKNNQTVYAYQKDSELLLDIKGASGGQIVGQEEQSNRTEIFQDCDSMRSRIENLSLFESRKFSIPTNHEFVSKESVLLVASEQTCALLDNDLQDYIHTYLSEGRNESRTLCIPQDLIQKKDPSLIRTFLKDQVSGINGVILLGSDIPPFEFFLRSGLGTQWVSYDYGTTDLPYGEFNSHFWSKPRSKHSPGIAENIYKSENFIYKMTSPTSFTYDLDRFVSSFGNGAYQQKLWVSRWLSMAVTPENLKSEFRNFLNRRKNYKPYDSQRLVLSRGAESFMLNPGDHSFYSTLSDDVKFWNFFANFQNEALIYPESDMASLIKQMDPSTTILSLTEHGNAEAMGNIFPQTILSLSKLPALVNFGGCETGAWGYAAGSETSLLASVFSISEPPIGVIASQGITSMPTFGRPDIVNAEILLSRWKSGQSLGSRLIETFEANLEDWRTRPFSSFQPAAFPAQLFHTVSIFGDGTLEN